MIESLISAFRNNVSILVQTAVSLFALCGVLITPFPLIDLKDTVNRISVLIIIAILAFMQIPLVSFNKRFHFKVWGWAALLFFFLTIYLSLTFNKLIENNTLKTLESNQIVLIGGDNVNPIFKDELDRLKKQYPSNVKEAYKQLLFGSANEISEVWPENEIKKNEKLIIISFTGLIVILIMFLFTLTQMLTCLYVKDSDSDKNIGIENEN